MKHLILFIALIFSTNNSFSQFSDNQIRDFISKSNEDQLIRENTRLMIEGFLYQAEMVTDKLLTFQPENPNYNYRKGYLIMEISKNHQIAIPYLEKAITNTLLQYNPLDTEELSAPVDAFYHLAVCYHLNEEIDKAISNYTIFLAKTYSKSELISVAKLKLKQCELAKKLMNEPVKVILKNVGSNVNNEFPDYSPVVSLD